jgi:hypothetical protein
MNRPCREARAMAEILQMRALLVGGLFGQFLIILSDISQF